MAMLLLLLLELACSFACWRRLANSLLLVLLCTLLASTIAANNRAKAKLIVVLPLCVCVHFLLAQTHHFTAACDSNRIKLHPPPPLLHHHHHLLLLLLLFIASPTPPLSLEFRAFLDLPTIPLAAFMFLSSAATFEKCARSAQYPSVCPSLLSLIWVGRK